jgi:hypothetical protein
MTELGHADRYAGGEELVFQMSSEPQRQRAIDAFETAYGGSLLAFPVRRRSTPELLLLVVIVENPQHVALATHAVLSVDPDGQQPRPGLASQPMPFAPNGHRVETVRYDAMPDQPRTEYAATCVDCRWMGLSRGSRVRADQDVGRHNRDERVSSAADAAAPLESAEMSEGAGVRGTS